MGENELLHELFRRVYRVSSPPANYDELLENAEVNERGQKVIPFDDYECSIDVMENILKQFFIDYNITSEWDKRKFSNLFRHYPQNRQEGSKRHSTI